MYFQREIEEKAFRVGNGTYFAPAQRVKDFLEKRESVEYECEIVPSYKPGVIWTSLDKVLPEFVCNTMRMAIVEFNKKIDGYGADDAVLTAPETRTSSPIRITRNSENLQSVNLEGLYPCGEGAGYAGRNYVSSS